VGTPDLLGTYGTFTLLTDSPAWLKRELNGGRAVALRKIAGDRFTAALTGPPDPVAADNRPLALSVELGVDAGGAASQCVSPPWYPLRSEPDPNICCQTVICPARRSSRRTGSSG
jgi:hypothetical protein